MMGTNSLSVDVRELAFSYTGTWTDTEMEIGGVLYRVLQLLSNGTLTFDERMVKEQIPFDVWGLGKGQSGSTTRGAYTSTQSMYTSCYSCGNFVYGVPVDYYSAVGSNGSASGWAIKKSVVTSSLTANANITSIASASLGDIFSFSGYSRTGTAWFTLPAGNNGAGGIASGHYYYMHSTTCPNCGSAVGGGYGGGDSSSAGSNGIIVIRLPIN